MNLKVLCQSMGEVLYEKGVMGHVTIDLVSFPNPTDPKAHPLFWAVDLNLEYSDFYAVTLFFDILMEGKLEQETGTYNIETVNDGEELLRKDDTVQKEPRTFMYCQFLHHPGLATI